MVSRLKKGNNIPKNIPLFKGGTFCKLGNFPSIICSWGTGNMQQSLTVFLYNKISWGGQLLWNVSLFCKYWMEFNGNKFSRYCIIKQLHKDICVVYCNSWSIHYRDIDVNIMFVPSWSLNGYLNYISIELTIYGTELKFIVLNIYKLHI